MHKRDLSQLPLVEAAGGSIGQIAMVVADIRQAIEMWGVSESGQQWRVWKYSSEMMPVQTYLGEPASYSMMLAMSGANPQLEFIEPLDGPSIYHSWVQNGRSGIHHLGFYVNDLTPVTARMVEAGYPVVMTGEGHGLDGSGRFAYYDTLDLLGCYVEGIEIPAARREPLYVWPTEDGSDDG